MILGNIISCRLTVDKNDLISYISCKVALFLRIIHNELLFMMYIGKVKKDFMMLMHGCFCTVLFRKFFLRQIIEVLEVKVTFGIYIFHNYLLNIIRVFDDIMFKELTTFYLLL